MVGRSALVEPLNKLGGAEDARGARETALRAAASNTRLASWNALETQLCALGALSQGQFRRRASSWRC